MIVMKEVPDCYRYGERPLPAEATDALPGSEAKLLVLCVRASRGEQLFHPDDAVLTLDAVVPTLQPTNEARPCKPRPRKRTASGVYLRKDGYYFVRFMRGHTHHWGGTFATREAAEQASLELRQRLDGVA